MLGKTIKVFDYGIISFFYPDFIVKTDISVMDKDLNVIYIGRYKNNLKKLLEENTKNYISTVGTPDLDFTNAENILDWVLEKKDKQKTDKMKESLQNLDYNTLVNNIKIFWITNRWNCNEDDSTTLFDLFSSSVDGIKSFITTYFNVLNNYSPNLVESSFLTFLLRVTTIEEQQVKVGYLKLLKKAQSKYGNKIKLSVLKNSTLDNSIDRRVRFLKLIFSLR